LPRTADNSNGSRVSSRHPDARPSLDGPPRQRPGRPRPFYPLPSPIEGSVRPFDPCASRWRVSSGALRHRIRIGLAYLVPRPSRARMRASSLQGCIHGVSRNQVCKSDPCHPPRRFESLIPLASARSKRAHSMIFDTTPAPTVRPPSRIAKRRPSSIAIGAIRSTFICTLSPGITISVDSGSSTAPVTSVVRK